MIQWGPKIETGNNAQPQLFDMQVSNFEEKNVAKDHPQSGLRYAKHLTKRTQ